MQHIPHHPLHGLHSYGQADGNGRWSGKIRPLAYDPAAPLEQPISPETRPTIKRQHPLNKIKMITGPLAMGLGYARSRDAGDSQLESIGKAFLLGFVSIPYLIYVGYDTYKD